MRKYSKPEMKIVVLSTEIFMALSSELNEKETGDNYFFDNF